MASEQEKNAYFAARDRAIERKAQGMTLYMEACEGFQSGLNMTDPMTADPHALSDYIDRVKSESNFGFGFICGVLCRLEAAKGKQYQASWQRQGEESAFYNTGRKFDRLEALRSPTSEIQKGDNYADTLGDLAVYASKWNLLRAELHPKEFEKWILYVRGL
jgi:hypothetical protein